jgi:superfamily II DNA or RNA helicase
MIAEGVDIPRLRVGVFFSRIKSKMFFNQFTGRFTRRQPDSIAGIHQDAHVFIYNHPELNQHAQSILETIYQAQVEQEKEKAGEPVGNLDGELTTNLFFPQAAQLELDGVITAGSEHSSEDVARARVLVEQFGLSLTQSLEMVKALQKHEQESRFPANFYSNALLQDEVNGARETIKTRVNRLAHRFGIEPSVVRQRLCMLFGPIGKLGKPELLSELEIVRRWEEVQTWEATFDVA